MSIIKKEIVRRMTRRSEETKLQKMIKKYAAIVLGTAMVGFAASEFYIPNKIVKCGLIGSGISILG